MAKLTSKQRDKLKDSTFGLPDERKYPIPDLSHAANAKARAFMMLNNGKLSKADYDKIVRKANRKLNE